MAKKRNRKTPISISSVKGKLVEQIVADLHDEPDTRVERNIFLSALGSKLRKREIDVLVTRFIEGKPVQIAIECKNYDKIIDVPLIDAFVGKLNDVGIPTQLGIFVSIKGFTDGAVERAAKAGIKTHILTGLTQDRLSAKINEAVQSVLFLLPTVTQVTIEYARQVPTAAQRAPFLCDASGQVRCSIFDLFWKHWREGFPPSVIGEHKTTVELSDGYFMLVDSKLEQVVSLSGIVQVTGLLLSVPGHAHQHLLVNQADREIARFQANASFSKPRGKQSIIPFHSEDDLQKFIDQQTAPIKLTVGRTRLPRVKAYSLYWPLSKRAFTEMIKVYESYQRGDTTQFNIDDFAYIEGTDLRTAWEPIWDQNPILKELA